MYLIIFDPNLIRDENRHYIIMNGDYYNRIIQYSPVALTITAKDIDEILIYSGAKMDAERSVKIATCASFEHGEGFLRIEYENIKSANITCSDVKGRVYHYCIKNNLLDDNNFCPNLFIVDNIQQYGANVHYSVFCNKTNTSHP